MTINSKIVSANLLVFGILVSAFAYFVYSRTAHGEIAAVDLRLESCAAKVITEFEDEWEEEKKPEWDDILSISAEGLDHLRMSLRTIEGRPVFGDDSVEPPSEELLRSILAGEIPTETIVVGEERLRKAVYPVAVDDEMAFTLTLTTAISDIHVRLDRLALVLVGSVLITLLVASMAVYLVTRAAFRPISRMVATAEQISANRLERRLQLPSREDEVTRLGRALNDMMDRIELAFRSQQQFVADASHELRTPLTVIIGELEFIQARLPQVSPKENVQSALDELDRLTRLVEQLLTLARIDAGRLILERESVRFDELIADCVRLMKKEAASKGIQLVVRIDNVVELDADPVRLKSVIFNLLDNAVKYTRDNGLVEVAMREIPTQEAELTISDTGPGIPVELRGRIFDRFYRGPGSRPDGTGSGLGLAITRELVELHGGSIVIEDNPGGGSLFRVIIPMN